MSDFSSRNGNPIVTVVVLLFVAGAGVFCGLTLSRQTHSPAANGAAAVGSDAIVDHR